ncbi:MAG: DUF6174 domain-containing protein [Longimicrobiales bacterium]
MRGSTTSGAVLVATLLASTNCSVGDFDPREVVREQLDAARDRWSAAGYEDYSVIIKRACGNCQGGTEFARLIVRNNARESATFFETGDTVPAEELPLYLTVLELFDVIDDALREGADEITVQYDALLAYPTAIFVDRVAETLNDEIAYTAHTVEPLN